MKKIVLKKLSVPLAQAVNLVMMILKKIKRL